MLCSKRHRGRWIVLLVLGDLVFAAEAGAHPGRLDGDGCHTCRTNCERWGLEQGQYHCHDGSSRRGRPRAAEEEIVGPVPFVPGAGGPGRPAPEMFREILRHRAEEPQVRLPDVPMEQPEELRVLFWNAKRLGHGTKDLGVLLDLIDDFDVVALGEVMRIEIIGDLVALLGAERWDSVVSPAIGRTSYREHYAVLFRRDQVERAGGVAALHPDSDDVFAREPFVVGLRARAFDFTLAVSHITWGTRRERVAEVDALADTYRELQSADPREQDVVLVGDFNVEPRESAWSRMLGLTGIRMLIESPIRTTLGRRGFASLYDNIIVQSQHTTEWSGRAGSVDTTRLYGGSFADTGRQLSDHVPIWATFATNGPDDD